MQYNITEHIKAKYFGELSPLSPCTRQAKLFKYITEEMPLNIKDSDYIAGWYGYENDDMPTPDKQDFPQISVLSEEQKEVRNNLRYNLKTEINFTESHTCIDYGKILEKGLEYYINSVENALAEEGENEFLSSMKLSLEAACKFAERFAILAKEKAENTADQKLKTRFEAIGSALYKVPRKGAETFLEAVQSLWIVHSLIPMAEMSWASISIGRLDQILYPFYNRHIKGGGSKEEVKNILKNLFLLLDSYGDGACNVNVGGMDEKGKDMINELSLLLIETEKEMSLRAPIFSVRVTPDMPEEVFDSLIDFNLFKIGQPTFYGELNCRKAVMDRGVLKEDAVNFSTNSCMGLVVAGKEFADMWGIKFNTHLPLELAANGGKPLNTKLGLNLSVPLCDITNFSTLLEQYGNYFTELFSISAKIYEGVAKETEANSPDPFLSALIDGCIKNRRDRAMGAEYNTVTVEMMGFINACDSIYALKELVFEKEKYALNELIAAAKSNYEGYENIRLDMLKCKKYGMNDSSYNAFFGRICETVSSACKKASNDNRIYLPSLHTIEANIEYGMNLYATLDGRQEGVPVNKNANPSILLEKTEHTSHILSATSFDQTKFSGGQPIDLYFDKTWFNSAESRNKIKALIKTYFQLGGLQLQVNSIDVDLLEKAHEAPQDYPFVIVRKGGYSVRFNEMNKHNRAEFITHAKRMDQDV